MSLSSDNKLYELAYAHVNAKAIQIAITLELDRILEEHSSLSLKELAEIVNFDSSGLKNY